MDLSETSEISNSFEESGLSASLQNSPISPIKLDDINYLTCSCSCNLAIAASGLTGCITEVSKEPTMDRPTRNQ